LLTIAYDNAILLRFVLKKESHSTIVCRTIILEISLDIRHVHDATYLVGGYYV
jgi:hypothetical protein